MHKAIFNRRHVLGQFAAGAAALALGRHAAAQNPSGGLTAAQAQRDLAVLQRALTTLHPGLYRYTTPDALTAVFSSAQQSVAAGADRAQMFVLASRIAASVHCGHTWANRSNQGPAVVAEVFNRADKLPITLRWLQGRALITGSLLPAVAVGTELLSIDGRPVQDIAAAVLPHLRADGLHSGSQAKRLAQLNSGSLGGAMDSIFPLIFAPSDSRYRLGLRSVSGALLDVTVPTTTQAERDKALPEPGSEWTLRIDGKTAVLTLPTFAFWARSFDAAAFLARSFETLRNVAHEVPQLIIDIRRCEGGDESLTRRLLTYLLRSEATLPAQRQESAYERVPYDLARYLDTWDFSFFDRTGQVTPGPDRAGRKTWLMPSKAPLRIEPVATPYAGRTVLLVGPVNSSAGFQLARDAKATGAATLIGQPTGGNLRGLNSGQLAWINLPHSGVGIDIPLLASYAAGDPPDSGVVPDVTVAPSFADAQAGVDTDMQAALRWLNSRSS
jgi:hypothetical protein